MFLRFPMAVLFPQPQSQTGSIVFVVKFFGKMSSIKSHNFELFSNKTSFESVNDKGT